MPEPRLISSVSCLPGKNGHYLLTVASRAVGVCAESDLYPECVVFSLPFHLSNILYAGLDTHNDEVHRQLLEASKAELKSLRNQRDQINRRISELGGDYE